MSKVIAIFGAGQGWSYQVGVAYAKNGYQVVFVSRTQSRLDGLAKRLEEEVKGAKVTTYTADLTVEADLTKTITAILDKFTFVDALYFGPAPADIAFVPAASLTREQAGFNTALYFLAVVTLVQGFLPKMLEKKTGSIVIGGGSTAINVHAGMSGPGPAHAALRNYILTLHKEVEDKGVSVGIILVGALIKGSHFIEANGAKFDKLPTVESTELAELVWEVAQKNEAERFVSR